jgi:hypothetical protein
MLDTASAVVVARPRAVRPRSRLYVALSIIAVALVLAGFRPYFFALLAGSPPAVPAVIHLHAAVFSGWLVLFAVQIALVFRGRTALHRKLGRFGIGYGVLMLALGLVVSLVAPARHVASGEWTVDQAAGFMILPFGDLVLFVLFFGGAIAYRRKPEMHKRLIVLTTIAVLFPAAARFAEPNVLALLLVWLLPLFIVAVNDIRTRGRVHAIYVVGAVVLLVAFARVFLMQSPAWLRLGRRILAITMTHP